MASEEFHSIKIDRLILCLIGICAVLYSIFYRFFAELNIKLPFLNFPIFVGEILLIICLILSLYKWARLTKFHLSFSWWKAAFVFYIIFVLAKAALGYFQYGPLALRHAAMFYYPLFAAIVYYAFQRDIFSQSINFLLFGALLLIINFAYVAFHLYTYLILVLILASLFKKKLVSYSCFIIALAIVPYGYFFHASRTLLVASLIAFFSLLIMNSIILQARKVFKVTLLFLGLLVIGIAIFTIASRGIIVSLTSPVKFMKYKNFYDRIIESRKTTFKPQVFLPQLYNPNETVSTNKIKSVFTRLEQRPVIPTVSFFPSATKEKRSLNKPTVGSVALRAQSPMEAEEGKLTAPYLNRPKVKPVALTPQSPMEAEEERKLNDEIRGTKFGTMLFRAYVYSDAVDQLLTKKPLFGLAFGYPFRSLRCEIMGSAYGEYTRDGWISMHNSYLDIIYRTGLAGIILFLVLFYNISKMVSIFLRLRSKRGVALITVIFFWLVICFFSETLELPYYAIPFWSLYGLTLAFADYIRRQNTGYSK